MTYTIYTDQYFVLIRQDKDWLTQCQDNVTKWDIGSWRQQPDFSLGQFYNTQVATYLDITLHVVNM